MSSRSDRTGFQGNHPHRRKADLEGDMGTVWVKPRSTLSYLAVRVKAMSPVSQSCLEVMILNLPDLFGCHPVVRRTHVLMEPIRVKGGDFPGGTVVKTLRSQCRGPGFDPWSGN